MPVIAKTKCQCGCRQAPHSTTRQRLCECVCGRKARQTREWLAAGALKCPCGGELLPVCLFDRACLPGDEGRAAYGEYAWQQAETAQRSENGRKAVQGRRRCKSMGCGSFVASGNLHCRKHSHEEMPF